jgi:hypothetical protein
MCFSATGSFTVSVFLTGVGAASLGRNRTPAARMLAAIPLLFAAQQCAEGVVWLTVGADPPGVLHLAGAYVFLTFALVVWPTWFPLSALRLEPDADRQRWIRGIAVVGAATSAVGVAILVAWPVHTRVAAHSIHYAYGPLGGPWLDAGYLGLYVIPAVLPFLLATPRLVSTTGTVLLVALVTTLVVKVQALTSVWCFFAAAISVLIIVGLPRSQPQPA